MLLYHHARARRLGIPLYRPIHPAQFRPMYPAELLAAPELLASPTATPTTTPTPTATSDWHDQHRDRAPCDTPSSSAPDGATLSPSPSIEPEPST